MSAYLLPVAVPSAAKLDGTVERKTKKMRSFDSVVGFMRARQSRLHDMCRQREKGMVFDELLSSIHNICKNRASTFVNSGVEACIYERNLMS